MPIGEDRFSSDLCLLEWLLDFGMKCASEMTKLVRVIGAGLVVEDPGYSGRPWLLRCGPWTSSIGITLNLIRNTESRTPSQTLYYNLCFNQVP